MDNAWITWIVQIAVTTAMGVIAYYVKRDQRVADDKTADNTRRIQKLEERLGELPFVYTTREDFILSMGKVEQKLDKILDRIADSKEG